MNKGKCSIDRIHNPTSSRAPMRLALFFAQHAIIWKPTEYPLSQIRFRFAISDSHETAISLFAGLRTFLKVLQRDVARTASEFDSKLDQFVQFIPIDSQVLPPDPRLFASSARTCSKLTPRATNRTIK